MDSLGKTIYPDMIIISNSVKPYRSKSNSKYWDDLKIETDTLIIKNADLDALRWAHIDSSAYYLQPLSGRHYLEEEIKVIAVHNNKTMVITFIGQGMGIFGCWASDHQPRSIVDILFEEGDFLFSQVHFSEKVVKTNGDIVSRQFTKLYKGAVPKDFKMITELKEIDNVNNFYGFNEKHELVPINDILKYDTEVNGEAAYVGFLLDKKIPVGYCLILNGVNKTVLFNKEYQKSIKKYYREQNIER